jgi:diacylglycerol kinase (ATP)
MGLDAEAARLANEQFRCLPGAARYIAAALWARKNFLPLKLEVRVDEQSWSGPALIAAVANAPVYGSGLRVAPAAEMDDGWLDVTLVEPLGWTELLEAIPVMLRTGDLRLPQVQRYRGRSVSLQADRRVLFHGDGEVLGEAPVEIEVLPGAIQVVAPPAREGTKQVRL